MDIFKVKMLWGEESFRRRLDPGSSPYQFILPKGVKGLIRQEAGWTPEVFRRRPKGEAHDAPSQIISPGGV